LFQFQFDYSDSTAFPVHRYFQCFPS